MSSPIPVSQLPSLNATLNAIACCLLTAGYVFIRRKNVRAHKLCMLSAFAASTLFLTSYVIYHYHSGSVAFGGRGWVRPLYFTILISHVVLAAAIPPLAIITLRRALRGRFDLHVRIARRTLPLWLYVSVTGVVIYWMLYRLHPPG